MIISADEVVSGARVLAPGWLRIDDGAVIERGEGRPSEPHERLEGMIVPGFADVHVHGALGIDFSGATAEEARRAVAFHESHGSTTVVASLATSSLDRMRASIVSLAPLVDEGVLAGLHLEGPYLAAAQRGAHNPEMLREPDADEIGRLLEDTGDAVRMVTIAPELSRAEEAIAALRARGIVVALGHSDADSSVARRAVGWGASVVTHLFNGMRPFHHRDPGLAGMALSEPDVFVEVIADGHHLAGETIDVVRASAGGRYFAVSDAMAATGLGDDDYTVAGSAVRVKDGIARTRATGSLAGSTSTVLDAYLRLRRDHGLDPVEAVAATSGTARRALGLAPASLEVGHAADLLVIPNGGSGRGTGSEHAVRVLKGGKWLE